MKKKLTLILCLLFLVTVLSCASHEAGLQKNGLKPMTQEEMIALFSKTVNTSYTGAQTSGTATFNPNQTASVTWKGGGGGSDSGSYTIKDGIICMKWKNLRSGAEKCFRWYKVSEKEYHCVDPSIGSLEGKFYLK